VTLFAFALGPVDVSGDPVSGGFDDPSFWLLLLLDESGVSFGDDDESSPPQPATQQPIDEAQSERTTRPRSFRIVAHKAALEGVE
jgi:hypothetical protein